MKTANDYQRELLEILLQQEVFYPWDPAAPEAEDYLTEQQENISFAETLNSDELLKFDSSLYSKKD